VLLGRVSFDYAGVTPPVGVTITYGRGDGTGDYKNFVGTDGFVYDNVGVSFAVVETYERGDANGDGSINVQDILNAKTWLGNPDAPPWVDCNGDGPINVQDVLCIKSKL
jgi:hypothetical protein